MAVSQITQATRWADYSSDSEKEVDDAPYVSQGPQRRSRLRLAEGECESMTSNQRVICELLASGHAEEPKPTGDDTRAVLTERGQDPLVGILSIVVFRCCSDVSCAILR